MQEKNRESITPIQVEAAQMEALQEFAPAQKPASAKRKSYSDYSDHEEIIHSISHGIGAVLAVVALIVLIMRAIETGGAKEIVAVSLYGASMILLYVCSTIYHGAFRSRFHRFWEMVDHAAIYVKIAGSYTPFALLILTPKLGTTILIAVWSLALLGITFKILTHFLSDMRKYDFLSLAGYLGMGWLAVFFMGDLYRNLPQAGFWWLAAGGAMFTIGAVFYAMKKLKYSHAIFHGFVLAGSACHFVSVYGYVLGSQI